MKIESNVSKIQKSRLKVLNDTVKYFNSRNRSVVKDTNANDVGCKYYLEEKNDIRKCAIGRLLTDKRAKELEKLVNEIHVGSVGSNRIFSQLPKSIQKYGIDFLEDLQMLHDLAIYWNYNGLSKTGKIRYKQIIKEWSL